METGHPKAVVTLAAFDSGDASLYFSNGGGVLGGIGHETVRTAAVSFVESSRALLPSMSKTQETPLPPVGVVRFYVLTGDGIFTAEAPENELGNGGSCLSPLFYAGCDVITQLRLVTETPRRYEGKPLLMLLESYILDCIGQLPAEKEAGLPPIVQRLYGGGEDWKATLRAKLGLPDSIDENARVMWARHQQSLKQPGPTLAPEDFARRVVEESFAHMIG
jgi:hypothetical protein